MAAHLHRSNRGEWARRRRLLLERGAAPEGGPTPTPPPVAVAVEEPRFARAEKLPERSVESPSGARSSLRVPLSVMALALLAGAAVAFAAPRHVTPSMAQASLAALTVAEPAPAEALTSAAEPVPVEAPAPPAAIVAPPPRADAHIKHAGYAHVPDGVVYLPDTFSSDDGAYDLYLHFHGNTAVVRESAEHAGLNAVVAVVNIGKNSAPYLDAFAVPGSYEHLLGSIDRAVRERGLEHPHVRRVAVGSWSGGYGAVSRILEHGRGLESLDAVLVLDGIHCGFSEDNPKELNARIISPFFAATRRAAEGKILFSITHSEIDPIGYAGTYLTAGYLLDLVHGRRGEPRSVPEHVELKAAERAVAKRLEKFMDPISEATVGTFHVRGYRGNTPEHHMAHLLQMGATVLPELVERWRD
jgi:hypothetical protein